MEAVRLRLLFEDRYILRKSQRKDGLRRSWILLKPQHQTISDLSSYILHLFRLHHSCPHGLILSMDGFVLPPFESTCVLNDKDIISVKKKGGTLTGMIEVGDGVNSLEGEEVLERQPVVPGVKLLANQEFEKETGGHDTELEENGNERLEDAAAVEATPDRSTVLKKRKASEKLPSSKKKKKSKFANTGTSLAALEVAEIDVHQDRNKSPHHINVLLKKNDVQEDKWNDIQRKAEKSCSSDELDLEKRSDLISKSLPDSVRLFQLQEIGEGNVDVCQTPGGAKKFPSRSARRKKAKRRWLREQARLEKELQQKQLLEKDNQQLPSKENFKVSEEHQQPVENGEHDAASDTDGDEDDNVFPIVVRPGHIRFEPLEKADEDQSVWQNQFSMGTFQWNGINSKKKGQKWGKEKIVSSKRNNYKNSSQACAEEVTVEEEMPVDNQVQLDKLMPYSSLPKEGDVVAYRLIELSSSWTPELSSFRVGKISHHDSVSNRIKLARVAEYPITNQENVDKEASGLQPDTSLYAEDGSLEIDYSSLVDLRLVKHGNSNSAISVIDGANENCVHVQDAVTSTRPDNSILPAAAPPKENGATNAWEEIAQALDAKKAELSKEDEWSNTKSSGKSSWSYRALRGSALGPTMAILRAQNEI